MMARKRVRNSKGTQYLTVVKDDKKKIDPTEGTREPPQRSLRLVTILCPVTLSPR